jgi:hypothetical protein
VTTNCEKIWFNPPKFWEATRNMSREEADRLMSEVFQLAEAGRVEELRSYDFIGIGRNYIYQPLQLREIA